MEIESLDQLDTLLTTGSTLCGLRLQGLDLCGHEQALLARTDAYAGRKKRRWLMTRSS